MIYKFCLTASIRSDGFESIVHSILIEIQCSAIRSTSITELHYNVSFIAKVCSQKTNL